MYGIARETSNLDLYGGHAVISVGHNHPTYVKAITEQVNRIRLLLELGYQ